MRGQWRNNGGITIGEEPCKDNERNNGRTKVGQWGNNEGNNGELWRENMVNNKGTMGGQQEK